MRSLVEGFSNLADLPRVSERPPLSGLSDLAPKLLSVKSLLPSDLGNLDFEPRSLVRAGLSPNLDSPLLNLPSFLSDLDSRSPNLPPRSPNLLLEPPLRLDPPRPNLDLPRPPRSELVFLSTSLPSSSICLIRSLFLFSISCKAFISDSVTNIIAFHDLPALAVRPIRCT